MNIEENVGENKSTEKKKINLEESKKYIENILRIQQYNMLERAKASIQSIIDGYLKNEQITPEEYDILNEFLEERILSMQAERAKKEQESKEKKQAEIVEIQGEQKITTTEITQVQEETKKGLNYIPIYHGKFNQLPPKCVKDDKEEER